MKIRMKAATMVPPDPMSDAPVTSPLHRQEPVASPSRSTPPRRDRPPRPVVTKACVALFTASSSSRSHPIRKNELIEVSSQKRTVSSMWSARTTPSIAVVKSPRVGKNRASDGPSLPK